MLLLATPRNSNTVLRTDFISLTTESCTRADSRGVLNLCSLRRYWKRGLGGILAGSSSTHGSLYSGSTAFRHPKLLVQDVKSRGSKGFRNLSHSCALGAGEKALKGARSASHHRLHRFTETLPRKCSCVTGVTFPVTPKSPHLG